MKHLIRIYERKHGFDTKPFLYQLSASLIALLAILSLSSCVYDDYEPGTEAYKGDTFINLSVITSGTADNHEALAKGTRVADDENPANPTSESNIHSIRVWVFDSESTNDNAIAIGYRKEVLPQPVNGETEMHSVSIQLLRNAIKQNNQHLDLYVLANAESIGTTSLNGKDISFADGFDEKTLTRQQLKELVMKSQFGITNEGVPQNTVAPTTGLPLSRVITHIQVENHVADTETGAAAKAVTVPLVRSVSKLHFFFARKADGGTDKAAITKIELDENIIPTASYVFPDATTEAYIDEDGLTSTLYNNSTEYVSRKMMLEGVANKYINAVADPLTYRRGTAEKAANYMTRLAEASFISHNTSYLRESNKPIKGRIFFKLDETSPEQSTEFVIPSNMKPAARNHELVVYAYFLDSGKLTIEPSVLDWEDGGKYDFIDKLEVHTIVEGGYQTTDGRIQIGYNDPTFGPKITFENIYTGGRKWVLQSSNPLFGFILAGDASGEIRDNLQGYGNKETISFYVVPRLVKDIAKPHTYETDIYLTVVPNKKTLINVGEDEDKLPGTPTEISFIQVK